MLKTDKVPMPPLVSTAEPSSLAVAGDHLGHESGEVTPKPAETWVRDEDCRLGMAGLSDASASLVLTDPPYFIDGMGSDWDMERLKRRTKPGVVGGIPAGQRFDPRQGANLQSFLTPIAVELMRIIKPGGFLLCFSQPRLVHRAALAIENAGFEIRDMLGWKFEGQAKAFSQDHFVRKMDISESEKSKIISKLGGRKTPQLRPQMELIVLAQAPKVGTFVENWLAHETGLIDVSEPLLSPLMFPGTLMPCPKPKSRYNHITVKPVDLCRHLIRIFSSPGSLVLDPFAGTGTTGVAALSENRDFLGFEKDVEMASTANQRIAMACHG